MNESSQLPVGNFRPFATSLSDDLLPNYLAPPVAGQKPSPPKGIIHAPPSSPRAFGAFLLLALSAQASAATILPAIPAAPNVDARNYVLSDPDSGQTLVEHDSDKQVPPASLTKLMTAYITFQALAEGKLKL